MMHRGVPSSMRTNRSNARSCEYNLEHKFAHPKHRTHYKFFVFIFFRNSSNRHTRTETTTGKQTTSRTAQALQLVTARRLTGHQTIARLLENSAKRRLARFGKQGRKPKLLLKLETSAREENVDLPTEAPISHTTEMKKKERAPKSKSKMQLAQARKARAQQRVKDALAASAARKNKK